jgi:hypothetical protein
VLAATTMAAAARLNWEKLSWQQLLQVKTTPRILESYAAIDFGLVLCRFVSLLVLFLSLQKVDRGVVTSLFEIAIEQSQSILIRHRRDFFFNKS